MAKTEEPGERWKEEREREAKSGELKATKDWIDSIWRG